MVSLIDVKTKQCKCPRYILENCNFKIKQRNILFWVYTSIHKNYEEEGMERGIVAWCDPHF